jgi:hypothetical protein
MKATSLSGQKASLQTDYVLKVTFLIRCVWCLTLACLNQFIF